MATAQERENGVYFDLKPGYTEAMGRTFPYSLGPFGVEPTTMIKATEMTIDLATMMWSVPTTKIRNRVRKQGRANSRKLEKYLGKGNLEGALSPLSPVTLPGYARAEAGIPADVTQFAWSYPVFSGDMRAIVATSDVCFLVGGGFIYFDENGKPKWINALMPSGRAGTIPFGEPMLWKPEWTIQLRKEDRFCPITIKELLATGASEFCWIVPGEIVGRSPDGEGGVQITEHGAFAYLFENESGRLTRVKSRAVTQRDANTSVQEVDSPGLGCLNFCCVQTASSSPVTHEPLSMERATNLEDGPDGLCDVASGKIFKAVSQQIPVGFRLCVLGGLAFNDQSSEALAKEVASVLTRELANQVVVITTGNMGTQEAFVGSLGKGIEVINLVCEDEGTDYSEGFTAGRDVVAGSNKDDRSTIYSNLGQMYITFEGGVGLAQQARVAFERGAALLPMMWTGGASSGEFGFPEEALCQPNFGTSEQWWSLKERSSQADCITTTATAAVQLIKAIVQRDGIVLK